MYKEIADSVDGIITEMGRGAKVFMLIPVTEKTDMLEMSKAAGYVVQEAEKVSKEPEEEPVAEKPKKGRRKKEETPKKEQPFDMGKAMALKNAGWRIKDIADEMGFTEAEVFERLEEEHESQIGRS